MADVTHLVQKLLEMAEDIKLQAMNRLDLSAEIIATKSDELCPKDTNALVNSRKIRRAEDDPEFTVEIVYGGLSTADKPSKWHAGKGPGEVFVDYAVYVHEVTTHTHDSPTQARFLSTAAEASRAEVTAILSGPMNFTVISGSGRTL